jgi:hypothetical protein
MEREPDNPYTRGEEWPPSQTTSPEAPSRPAEKIEQVKGESKKPESIEALGREALEHELSFERDPQLRHLSSEQVKAILAAQERAERAAKLGSSSIQSASQAKDSTKTPSRRKSGPTGLGTAVLNRRAADYVMAAIIAVLLLVVFLLLIFR